MNLNDKKIDELRKKIVKDIENVVEKNVLSSLGEFISRMIRVRTRLGYGVEGDGRKKLKKIKKETIDRRKKNPLYEETTPSRSNLTRTGQLLNSIAFRTKKMGLTIFIPDKKRSDSNSTNAQVALGQEKQGRKFFDITKSEVNQIKKQIVKLLKDNGLTKLKK